MRLSISIQNVIQIKHLKPKFSFSPSRVVRKKESGVREIWAEISEYVCVCVTPQN